MHLRRRRDDPWSDPLNFCLNGSGIDEAAAIDIMLTPNPAGERVTVADTLLFFMP